MRITRPVLNPDQKLIQLKKQKDQLGSSVNVLQLKHEDTVKRLLGATKTCEIEEKKAKELKLSNEQAKTSLTTKNEAILTLDNEFKVKKARNEHYDIEFNQKVVSEKQRIEQAIPELIFKHDELIEKIQDLSDESDEEKDNLDSLNNEKFILTKETKVLQTKKEFLNNDILAHNTTIVTKNTEIDTQNLTIQGNTNTIEYLNTVLSEMNTAYEVGKEKIIENNIKIADQGRTIKENNIKISVQAKQISDFNNTVANVNIKDRKLNEFAKTLEKKALDLGVHIKLT